MLQSSAYADAAADPETVTDLTTFGSFEGHRPARDARRRAMGGGRVTSPIEATLSQPAAAALGVATGDTCRSGRAASTRAARSTSRSPGPGAPTRRTRTGSAIRSCSTGPRPAAGSRPAARWSCGEADLTSGPLSEALDAQWRAIPDDRRVPARDAGRDGDRRERRCSVASTPPSRQSNQASVATKLPDILASVDRSVLVAQSGILLLLVQFGVLAAYAVILVAALLLERRRTETALLRSRGAGTGHLVAMAFGEALLVVVPAVIAAPWLAMLLVQAVAPQPGDGGRRPERAAARPVDVPHGGRARPNPTAFCARSNATGVA